MFPLPALPFLPKLHRFFEPEQAKSFALVFGIALLVQAFLPWGGGLGFINIGAGTIWPLIVGAGFVALTFVPGLADKLKPGLFFLIVAGAGTLGVLWSFAAAGGPFFWGWGFGTMGLAATCAALFLWARNGYSQLYWTILMAGIIGVGLGLVVPMGGGLPLIRIFTSIGDPAPNIIARLLGTIFALAFLGLFVLMVMGVFLKKDQADKAQVERFGATIFVASLLLPLVYGLVSFSFFGIMLHTVLTTGIFVWLTIWGIVCYFEAKERGVNLLQFS